MENESGKPEFWESAFIEKQEMWGSSPAQSAILVKDFLLEHGVKSVLIPGIGYGRNAKIFSDSGLKVTGIEISKTAIDLAKKHVGLDLVIHHGSVTDMPFDNHQYDAIFCYALIHLLDAAERQKLIRDCYDQLAENGYMIFTVISKQSRTYGQGTLIGQDRYEQFGGIRMFFYDTASVEAEFGDAGLVEVTEIMENLPFLMIKCKKTTSVIWS